MIQKMKKSARISRSRSARLHSHGATLLEILVTLLVLSFGLLGMAGLQVRAVKGNLSAMQRTQAVMMSYYILDAMRVDSSNAKLLAYNTGAVTGSTIEAKCSSIAYTGSTLADHNMKHWIDNLKTTIGVVGDTSTCGAINCDADGVCEVQVRWDDTAAGGLGAQMVSTITRL